MTTPPAARLSGLRGATRLAADATLGLADLVEAVHQRVASRPGAPNSGRTAGVTGLVYKSIRGVTRLVGSSLDGLLDRLAPLLGPGEAIETRERLALVAALNGVLGDHLAASANPLATAMTLRQGGKALTLDAAALRADLTSASGHLLVLVHGLCMNDLQWHRDGHDHGQALAREFGCTPVYLRYNSGLPVHVNGTELARQMQRLLAAWPTPLRRVTMLCHSMGGLLARSALHQAAQTWPVPVDEVFFLGTPHQGAPLERAGHGLDVVLAALPYAAPLARLGRVRSAGINDLRHGRLWPLADDTGPDPTLSVPLPLQPRCHAIAASLGPDVAGLRGRLLGDGLVPVASALGQHQQAARRLAFASHRQAVLQGLNHMQLLGSPEVYAQLRQWLR